MAFRVTDTGPNADSEGNDSILVFLGFLPICPFQNPEHKRDKVNPAKSANENRR
jgi:hypothetical protein